MLFWFLIYDLAGFISVSHR